MSCMSSWTQFASATGVPAGAPFVSEATAQPAVGAGVPSAARVALQSVTVTIRASAMAARAATARIWRAGRTSVIDELLFERLAEEHGLGADPSNRGDARSRPRMVGGAIRRALR